jgi:hypothetical protein
MATVHPGSFCSPAGAAGETSRGTAMVCSVKQQGDRARWRSANGAAPRRRSRKAPAAPEASQPTAPLTAAQQAIRLFDQLTALDEAGKYGSNEDRQMRAARRAIETAGLGEMLDAYQRAYESAGGTLADFAGTWARNAAGGPAVQAQVRDAYQQLARQPGDDWVSIARIRDRLPGVPRQALDAALRDLDRCGAIVAPATDQRRLTPADRAAAVRIGFMDNHQIRIDGPGRPREDPLTAEDGIRAAVARNG